MQLFVILRACYYLKTPLSELLCLIGWNKGASTLTLKQFNDEKQRDDGAPGTGQLRISFRFVRVQLKSGRATSGSRI